MEQPEKQEATINQGIYYLYLIIGMQVLFVFLIAGIIMVVGTVISTPLWVFLFVILLGASAFVYVYRKIRQQFRKLREGFKQVDLSDRNYEISVMGGFLTMRVEQNPRRLLDAPEPKSVIDTDTVDTTASQRPAG